MVCPACDAANDSAAEVCFTCRTVLAAVSQGTVLDGRYEILRTLGRGGMGVVYEALDRTLEVHVAIKVLRSELAESPDMARRFRSEIKLARKIRHANVCAIHEYGEDGALRFIAMELVCGIDLRRLIRSSGGLSTDRAFAAAFQVADGLRGIHQAGIVHRDLKATNIMVDTEGVVRLMDFGLAKGLGAEGSSGFTTTGRVMGTPEYMSPEQVRGARVDLRSDVYSLGVVLFEVFTGRVPFAGDTPVAVVMKHLQEPPPLDGEPARAIPGPLRAVLGRALAKEPEKRYADGGQLAAAVRDAWRLHTPGAAEPDHASLLGSIVTRLIQEDPVALPSLPTPAASSASTQTTSRLKGVDESTSVLPSMLTKTRTQPDADKRSAPRSRLLTVALVPLVAGGAYVVIRSPGTGAPSSAPRPSGPSVSSGLDSRSAVDSPVSTLPAPALPPAPAGLPADRPSAPPGTFLQKPRVRAQARPARATTSAVAATEPTPPAPSIVPAAPAPLPAATPPAPGTLRLIVLPWAEVTVEGRNIGTTPVAPLPLSPGWHTVLLTNPSFSPITRRVEIRAGETTVLEYDLRTQLKDK
jgi:serine/threonine-protein kinase